jgi:putative copper export protein
LALLLFVGAVVLRAVLSPGRARPWLAPAGAPARVVELLAARERSLVVDAGLAAVALGALVAVLDGGDAAGGVSLAIVRDFLLANAAGLGRVGAVGLVVVAGACYRRLPRLAAIAAALALGAVAVSGHAASASPRVLTVLTDWAHLLAAAVWLGGIASLVVVWWPALRGKDVVLRRAAMRDVLPRFGSVALPAFVLVLATGTTNALVQLGHPAALWQTGYGRVLAVKMALVAAIAGASYVHALRLRPRLLAANPHPPERDERRHWRLVGSEPWLAVGVVVAAAALAAFPLPPRQLSDAAEATAVPGAACNPCPLRVPAANELAVAGQGASNVVAAWIRRGSSALTGEVHLIDIRGRAAAARFRVTGARQASCGRGCATFIAPPGPTLTVTGSDGAHRFRTVLPASWLAAQSRRARRLLEGAERSMRGLRGVHQLETVTSGPGSFARTDYWLAAPNRLAFRSSGGEEGIEIGARQWIRVLGGPWQRAALEAGLPFSTRSWFRWTPYATAVRLLSVRRVHGRWLADLALMDPGTPAWTRLLVDLRTMWVIQDRLVTKAHFILHRYFEFNRRLSILAPARSGG